MNCKYLVKGEVKNCFYGFSGMSVYDGNWKEEGHYHVNTDEQKRKYFEVDGEKILLTDLICDTPQEFVDNIKDRYGDDLCNVLIKHGLASITVMHKVKPLEQVDFGGLSIAFQTSSNLDKEEDFDWVEYKFVDEYLRRPEDCYKLKMVPKNDDLRGVYPTWDTYVDDMVSLFGNRPDLYKVQVGADVEDQNLVVI